MACQLDLLLDLLSNAVCHNIDLNKKLIRDILDVCEGLSKNILNNRNNYDHATLKYKCKFVSKAAAEIRNTHGRAECIQKTHREHAIPLKQVTQMLYELDSPTREKIRAFIDKNLVSVLITKQERDLLDGGPKSLRNKMPDNWDGKDAFARFKARDIEINCGDSPN